MPVPITLIGNLTRDIELSVSPGGTTYGKSAVAINARQKDASGNWVDGEPSFYNLTIFGELAEHAAATVKKGTRVVVAGRIRQEKWQANDGTNRSDHVVYVDDIGPSLRWATAVVDKVERHNGAAPVPEGPPFSEAPTW